MNRDATATIAICQPAATILSEICSTRWWKGFCQLVPKPIYEDRSGPCVLCLFHMHKMGVEDKAHCLRTCCNDIALVAWSFCDASNLSQAGLYAFRTVAMKVFEISASGQIGAWN